MGSARRIGAESSDTRAALVRAAHDLIVDEGYAAVTSRRVADRAGLKPQLVHYYFRTMDELFVAMVTQVAEYNLGRHRAMEDSARPLSALWAFCSDQRGTSLATEFVALANHRKTIRAELLLYAEQFRKLQIEAAEEAMNALAVDEPGLTAEVLVVLMTGVSQAMILEETLGLTIGHDATRGFIETLISRYEPAP